eukprot:CAMPEP_0173441174 /NCGR_PEP_ID=MMETSP1357-20121228/23815_1 /TAXON_ID=77926 /ORGANISM="Hemiselmis rufescens, Strain PCC563" /LENGTH=257 /DNA_ID=CAMNT_0014406735 /DNA_START=23 /DNA_END=796 /DNA_ORIENTATION=-
MAHAMPVAPHAEDCPSQGQAASQRARSDLSPHRGGGDAPRGGTGGVVDAGNNGGVSPSPATVRKDCLRERAAARRLPSRQWKELQAWQSSLERPTVVKRRRMLVTDPSEDAASDAWSSANTIDRAADAGPHCAPPKQPPPERSRSLELQALASLSYESTGSSEGGGRPIPPVRRTRSNLSVRWPDEEDKEGKLTHELRYKQAPGATATGSRKCVASKKESSGLLRSWLSAMACRLPLRRLSLSGTRFRTQTCVAAAR